MGAENKTSKGVGISKETIVFLLLLVFAAVLYGYHLTYSDIWADEAFSKALARRPLAELLGLVAGDAHPPLYFVALKLFTTVVGNSDFTIRLFSVCGALAMLSVAYGLGRRVLGATGALYWTLFLLALPMPAIYSHTARMYTWTAFLVIGVFLSAILYAREGRTADLVRQGVFSLLAAYTHYYSLIAAFWIGVSLLVYCMVKKSRSWRGVAIMGVAVLALFVPWLFVLRAQAVAAHKDFWIPPLSWGLLGACYSLPFGGFFAPYRISWAPLIVVYGLTLASIGMALFARRNEQRLPLVLGLVGFHATVVTAVVVSLTFRPILYPRYMMTIVPLLLVPPVLVLLRWRPRWPRWIVLSGTMACGLYIVVNEASASYGPYRQALRSLSQTHPEVRRILHLNEITAGPFSEYGRSGPWQQFYLSSPGASWYTNMKALDGMVPAHSLRDMVGTGEVFCLVEFVGLPLNGQNLDLVRSQSDAIATETVVDEKPYFGITLKLHIFKARL